jgi:hypothetical protein
VCKSRSVQRMGAVGQTGGKKTARNGKKTGQAAHVWIAWPVFRKTISAQIRG